MHSCYFFIPLYLFTSKEPFDYAKKAKSQITLGENFLKESQFSYNVMYFPDLKKYKNLVHV